MNKNAYREFAADLLRKTYDPQKNTVLSPLSVLSMLSLAAKASAGDTREELIRVVGNGEILKDESGCLLSANAVCTKPYIQVNPEFSDSYDVIRYEEIHEWVSRNTAGMIRDINAGDADACILNAMIFEDTWEDRIEEIQNLDFHNADGTVSKVSMLMCTEPVYIETEDTEGFLKWYESGYQFIALLPKEEGVKAMKRVLKRFDYGTLYEEPRRNALYKVHAGIPEYTVDYETTLKEFCRERGIVKMFTEEADFSTLSREKIRIENVIHKTHINVDRDGTRAAGLTDGIALGCSDLIDWVEKTIILDRPFIFAVMNGREQLPVFAGVVNYVKGVQNERQSM